MNTTLERRLFITEMLNVVLAMIEFSCDSCRRLKEPGETWILGMAAESVGVTASRREVTILPTWDRSSSVHPLAVHFCSQRCKDRYLRQLFGSEAPGRERVMGRVVKTIPARVPRARKSASRKNQGKRNAA